MVVVCVARGDVGATPLAGEVAMIAATKIVGRMPWGACPPKAFFGCAIYRRPLPPGNSELARLLGARAPPSMHFPTIIRNTQLINSPFLRQAG